MDWFRWHHGSVTDPKFQLVARKSGRSVADVIAVWAVVLEHASKAENRGYHGNLDFESIDCLLGFPDGVSSAIYTALCGRGLIDGEAGLVVRWDSRQPRRERETDIASTERVKRHRAKVAQHGGATAQSTDTTSDSDSVTHLPLHGNGVEVTPCNAMERQKQPRGEERRLEESNTSFSDQGVGASSPPDASPSAPPTAGLSKNQGKNPSRRGTALPDGWVLPPLWRAFCVTERPDLDPDALAERFADHWLAQAGADGRKADWLATWRNWVRTERRAPNMARLIDVARATTPGPPWIDPVLQKIEADSKLAAPPPAYIRAQVAKHKSAGA